MLDAAAPLPFDDAIAFLRQKVNLPTRAWTDLKEGAHARGFSVAGATAAQLVEDFRQAVTKAIETGTTLTEFRKDFDRIVATHGWSHNGSRGWRSAVIYNTNLRMARSAGHWAQIRRTKADRPYIRYTAILDGVTRPLHRTWNGVILPADDSWWDTHFPPNGWNCRCTVRSVSEDDLRRYGWSVSAAPDTVMERRTVTLADGSTETWSTPQGIDTGFGYHVGTAWLSGAVPPQLQEPLPPLPVPTPTLDLPPLPVPTPVDAARLLPAGLAPEAAARRFLAEFGADVGRAAPFRDASGALLGIGAELFQDRAGTWKADKRGRQPYLLVLADALKDPDEIWVGWVKAKSGDELLRRRYLKSLVLPDGSGAVASFEWTARGWVGVTTFAADEPNYLDNQRVGALIYRRKG